MSKITHRCVVDRALFGAEWGELPSHVSCAKSIKIPDGDDDDDDDRSSEKRTISYTINWSMELTCIIEKDGPVTIMHYPHGQPYVSHRYTSLSEARPHLLRGLEHLRGDT